MRATGEVSCWRLGNAAWYGVGRRLGDGITPTVVPGVDRAVAVAAGDGFSCALGSDGRVTCWGFNNHRQLGDTTRAERRDPTTVCGLDRFPLQRPSPESTADVSA